MSIALTGLGGFDSSGIVDKLVALARQPLVDIDSQKSLLDSASSTLSSFAAKLAALRAAAGALSTRSGFASSSATSSDGAVVASVVGFSPVASYTVEVTRLARAQKLRSDVQPSATTALGVAGTLAIQVGTAEPRPVTVLATDTLTDVARKIAAAGARVTASVVGDSGAFRLLVQGLDTGADNAFTIGQSGLDLGLETPANVYETAENASLEIDGVPAERPTNAVSGLVPGVTLALKRTTSAPAVVDVAADPAGVTAKIEAFVKAYNDVVAAGHAAAGFGSTKATNRLLAADSTVRRSLDRIASLVASPVAGASAQMVSLASVGVRLGHDGSLSLDRQKLAAAFAADPDAVGRLFVEDASVGSTGLMNTFASTVDGLVTGRYAPVKNRLDTFATLKRRLMEARPVKEQRVAAYEAQLKRQFASLELAMSRYQSLSSTVSSIGARSGGDF